MSAGQCEIDRKTGGQTNESPPGEEVRWASLEDPKPGGGSFGSDQALGGGKA